MLNHLDRSASNFRSAAHHLRSNGFVLKSQSTLPHDYMGMLFEGVVDGKRYQASVTKHDDGSNVLIDYTEV